VIKTAPLNLRLSSQLLTGLMVLGAASLTGCVTPGSPISGGGGNLSPEERRLQDAENALVIVKRRLDGIDSALSDSGGNLAGEVRDLRGQVEELSNAVQQQEARSKQIFVELEQRIRRLEGGSSSFNGGGAMPPLVGLGGTAGSGANVGASPVPSVGGASGGSPQFNADEEASYLATFEMLKNGKYDEAITGFRQHLSRYPNGQYSDNAVYWMAEASFVKRDFRTARSGFEQVVVSHPDSPRAPDAMFKLALAQDELKQKAEARSTLQQLVSRYPDSNAARLAQQRLDAAR
jgi:tol-pal system protein YbgF